MYSFVIHEKTSLNQKIPLLSARSFTSQHIENASVHSIYILNVLLDIHRANWQRFLQTKTTILDFTS